MNPTFHPHLNRRQALQTGAMMLGSMALPAAAADQTDKPLKAGIIGLDTSHVTAFTKILNDPKASGDLAGVRVVAAYPAGSPDMPVSKDRIEGFTKTVRDQYQVEIVDSIDALLKKVDVVLLESVDGRPHLEQVKPVLKAGKPVFIDKPVAGSLADAIQIYELAKEHKVPVFSSSSMRFAASVQAARANEKGGAVVGCDVYGPCPLDPLLPDLFWYGIHGVELLFTIMGTGCESVSRVQTENAELVAGVWKAGRIGTFRGIRKTKAVYGATVFREKDVAPIAGEGNYEPLLTEIVKFFKTGTPPVSAEETLEIFAFLEAGDESKRQGGVAVKLDAVMAKARKKISG